MKNLFSLLTVLTLTSTTISTTINHSNLTTNDTNNTISVADTNLNNKFPFPITIPFSFGFPKSLGITHGDEYVDLDNFIQKIIQHITSLLPIKPKIIEFENTSIHSTKNYPYGKFQGLDNLFLDAYENDNITWNWQHYKTEKVNDNTYKMHLIFNYTNTKTNDTKVLDLLSGNIPQNILQSQGWIIASFLKILHI